MLAALAEWNQGLDLPNGAERVRTTLRLAWARRLPQLLTLPPFETCSDAYVEDILEVYHAPATLSEVIARPHGSKVASLGVGVG